MVWEFIEKYFISPVYTGEGYNIYNTLAYAALLFIGVYFVKRLLEYLEVRMDVRLFIATVPFLVLAGELRGMESYYRAAGQGVHPYLVTPGLYILVTTLAIASLLFGKKFTGDKYDRTMTYLGTAMAAGGFFLVLSKVIGVWSQSVINVYTNTPLVLHTGVFLKIWILAAVLSAVIVWGIKNINVFKSKGMYSRENALIIFGLMLMASSATLGSALLGYSGEQMLTDLMLSFSPYSYLLLNIFIVLGALYLIEDSREESWYWLFKITILVLGLPMGIHNSIGILMGV